jgi:hypothetical protein
MAGAAGKTSASRDPSHVAPRAHAAAARKCTNWRPTTWR